MVWSVFNYLLTQKLPRKAKVALVADRCSQYKKVAENAKSCSKVVEHNLFMPNRHLASWERRKECAGSKETSSMNLFECPVESVFWVIIFKSRLFT